ncbi:hypothetical protein HPB47_002076 [Ixodes persulcatus]|uniref:Uncharacterized protein n=1 Tax=Ixodes persulcatus TaxID=34615 RepID=A0AC60PM87_IXOPE|nr:hypothetical protein HPB47_002076 [Ixodes persulcatus]
MMTSRRRLRRIFRSLDASEVERTKRRKEQVRTAAVIHRLRTHFAIIPVHRHNMRCDADPACQALQRAANAELEFTCVTKEETARIKTDQGASSQSHAHLSGGSRSVPDIHSAPSTDGMNAEEAVRRAADFAHRAAAEDAAHNYGEAFSLYKHALFLYFLAAKEIRLESSSYIERTHEFIRYLGSRADADAAAPLRRHSSSGSNVSVFSRTPARGCEDTKAFHTSGVVVLGEAQVRWSDVFGLETLKRALMLNVVYPVKHPTLFEDAKPLSSLMLYGTHRLRQVPRM